MKTIKTLNIDAANHEAVTVFSLAMAVRQKSQKRCPPSAPLDQSRHSKHNDSKGKDN